MNEELLDKMNDNEEFNLLEMEFPLHNRIAEGWRLTGFMDTQDKPRNMSVIGGEYYNEHYPYGKVPIWRKIYS